MLLTLLLPDRQHRVDGVCIAGESFWVDTHDVVVRHMRFRRGETKVWHRDDSFGGNPIGNIMIDHCSCTWGLDENISFYRHMYDPSEGQYESKDLKLPTVNVTIQNTISAKALDTYNHAFGSTLGGENCAFMRNLWASNSGRNPSVGWNGVFNFVNNVVFNWVHRSSDGGDYTAMFNMINNYYKPGPATPKNNNGRLPYLKPEAGRSKLNYKVYGRVYADGNVMEGYPEITKITGMVVSKSRVSQIQRDILRICGAMSRLQCLISKLHQLMMLMIM